jgi:hypothetical protein
MSQSYGAYQMPQGDDHMRDCEKKRNIYLFDAKLEVQELKYLENLMHYANLRSEGGYLNNQSIFE